MGNLVSVVILNWNGEDYIKSCIESVRAQDYDAMEIIVVDNASQDSSVRIIQSFGDVRLIENESNVGFGGGNNIGIRQGKGDYILILNNDAELDRGCIRAMRDALDKHPKYGSCASKIYFKDNREIVDAAGIAVFPDGLSIGRGRFEHGSMFDKEEEVFAASGCCVLFRKETLEDIRAANEYYDEDFFAYADDTDLGWRAQLRGWKCIYSPLAKTYHMHSAASAGNSTTKAFLVERNRIWLGLKNFPVSLILYGQYFTLLRYIYQSYGAVVGKGASGEFSKEHSRGHLARVLLRAYFSAFKGYRLMIKKRHEILGRRTIGTPDMFRLLEAYGVTTRNISFMRSEAESMPLRTQS